MYFDSRDVCLKGFALFFACVPWHFSSILQFQWSVCTSTRNYIPGVAWHFLPVKDTQHFYFWLKLLHQSATNIQTWPTSVKLQVQRPHLVLETHISAPQDDSIFNINETLSGLDFLQAWRHDSEPLWVKNRSHLIWNAELRNEKAAADQ